MKKQLLILTFIAFGKLASAQSSQTITVAEKITRIHDLRSNGVSKPDMSAEGRTDGNVRVERIMQELPGKSGGKMDTAATYIIYFYKTYQASTDPGKSFLQTYYISRRSNEDYDKASYSWIKEAVVSVTLFNSTTNKQETIKLTTNGQLAAIVE